MSSKKDNRQSQVSTNTTRVTFIRSLDEKFKKDHGLKPASLQLGGKTTPLNSHEKNQSNKNARVAAPALTPLMLFIELPTLASREISLSYNELRNLADEANKTSQKPPFKQRARRIRNK